MAEHTHDYSGIKRKSVTHDHKAGGPHIHNGLVDAEYEKNVVAAEKRRAKAAKEAEKAAKTVDA